MTSTFTQVPPDSTGDKLMMRSYTRGSDVVHSQGVYFDGLPSYGLLCEGTTFAANAYHAYLRNDADSNQSVYLLGVFLINTQTAAITGGATRFDLRRVTGSPTMTAVTPFAFNTADPALANVTGGRTVTAGLTDGQILRPIMYSSDEQTASATNLLQLVDSVNRIHTPDSFLRPLVLRPGEAVALKQVTSVTAGAMAVLFHFAVEPD